MRGSESKERLQDLFETAGITLNGSHPWDIQVHNEELYDRVLGGGILSVGESYMDGWWDCDALDQCIERVFRTKLQDRIKEDWKLILHVAKAKILNLQDKVHAHEVAEKHYDIGNDLYEAMLDTRMLYTCGYWKDADNLDEAQEAKLDLICRKIGLREGMTVLDLGCGWGGFARYAAEKCGARVTAVNISTEQMEYAGEVCRGLPVELRLCDYRDVSGTYDRVVSIGIMEHVGYKNYRTYMEVVDRTLKQGGVAFVHTIGGNVSVAIANAWTTKYIFPNGMLPSIAQIGEAMEGLFVMEDWHNFGPDYDRTLMAWYDNVEKAWPRLSDRYDERFRRMWRFYLLSSAGAFRSRRTQLWHIVMTREGQPQPDCRCS